MLFDHGLVSLMLYTPFEAVLLVVSKLWRSVGFDAVFATEPDELRIVWEKGLQID